MKVGDLVEIRGCKNYSSCIYDSVARVSSIALEGRIFYVTNDEIHDRYSEGFSVHCRNVYPLTIPTNFKQKDWDNHIKSEDELFRAGLKPFGVQSSINGEFGGLDIVEPNKEDIKKPVRYNKVGKLECWDVIIDQQMNNLEGTVLKYLWRHKEKNGVEDLKKAREYLDKLISEEEKK